MAHAPQQPPVVYRLVAPGHARVSRPGTFETEAAPRGVHGLFHVDTECYYDKECMRRRDDGMSFFTPACQGFDEIDIIARTQAQIAETVNRQFALGGDHRKFYAPITAAQVPSVQWPAFQDTLQKAFNTINVNTDKTFKCSRVSVCFVYQLATHTAQEALPPGFAFFFNDRVYPTHQHHTLAPPVPPTLCGPLRATYSNASQVSFAVSQDVSNLPWVLTGIMFRAAAEPIPLFDGDEGGDEMCWRLADLLYRHAPSFSTVERQQTAFAIVDIAQANIYPPLAHFALSRVTTILLLLEEILDFSPDEYDQVLELIDQLRCIAEHPPVSLVTGRLTKNDVVVRSFSDLSESDTLLLADLLQETLRVSDIAAVAASINFMVPGALNSKVAVSLNDLKFLGEVHPSEVDYDQEAPAGATDDQVRLHFSAGNKSALCAESQLRVLLPRGSARQCSCVKRDGQQCRNLTCTIIDSQSLCWRHQAQSS